MSAPGYWMNERYPSVLRRAVERYLKGADLSPTDIVALRAYLRQWINSPVWDANPHGTTGLTGLRDMIGSLSSREQIDLWSRRAVEMGVNPW